jgi:hypothetical protein
MSEGQRGKESDFEEGQSNEVMRSEEETFRCDNCGRIYGLRKLMRRTTMSGEYCTGCASIEKCGACGEMCDIEMMTWKEDVQNFICTGCEYDYKEVTEYIKPIPPPPAP